MLISGGLLSTAEYCIGGGKNPGGGGRIPIGGGIPDEYNRFMELTNKTVEQQRKRLIMHVIKVLSNEKQKNLRRK